MYKGQFQIIPRKALEEFADQQKQFTDSSRTQRQISGEGNGFEIYLLKRKKREKKKKKKGENKLGNLDMILIFKNAIWL